MVIHAHKNSDIKISALADQAKIIEIDELAQRIEALENAAEKTNR
jgi:hypothetical protein